MRKIQKIFLGALGVLVVNAVFAASSVELRYTYRTEKGRAAIITGDGTVEVEYVSLVDAVRFYGIKLTYESQTHRLALQKGSRKVSLVVSKPGYLVGDTREAHPIEPVEMVAGELVATAQTIRDLLTEILNIEVLYIPEVPALYAGGISIEDVRREIMESAKREPPSLVAAPTKPVPELRAPTPPQVLPVEPTPTLPPLKHIKTSPSVEKAFQVRKIVIDPGHGGKDTGAVGYSRRFAEKTATLAISRKVAEILRQEPDLEILMTRDKDRFITLKDRTSFANRHEADLFVSIHCNANPRHQAKGTEVYVYSSKATGNMALVAHRENEGEDMEKDMDMKDFILGDFERGKYRERSYFLATQVNRRIAEGLGQRILRTEQAPFYVLARVDMPSILVETAFISNKDEEKKLKDPNWQDRMAAAIADGILAYREKVEASAEKHANKN